MELFKLFGRIAIDNEQANRDIDETSEKVEKSKNKFTSTIKTASKWGIAIGTAVVGATASLVAFAGKTAQTGDNIDKMSQKIGVSRQAYQELDFICSQSGTSVDNLQAGMKTLVSAMDGVANGTNSNIEQFEKLGVSVLDTDGNLRSSEDVMWETIESLQKMDNQTEKARLATELFGKSGTDLMPLLNGASGSIEDMKKQAHDLGLVMIDESVDASVKYTDTMDQLKRSFGAIFLEIGANVLPIIQKFSEKIVEYMPQIKQMISDIIEDVGKFLDFISENSEVIVGLSMAIGGAVLGFKAFTIVNSIAKGIEILTGVIKSWDLVTKAMTATQWLINIALTANPIGIIVMLVVVLIAAIALLVVEMVKWLKSNEEAMAKIKQFVFAIKARITDMVESIKEKISAVITFFKELPQKIIDFFKSLPQKFKEKFDELLEKFNEWKDGAIENIQTFFKELPQKIIDFFKSLPQKFKDKFDELLEKFNEWKDGAIENIQTFFEELPEKIIEWIKNLPSMLFEAGKNAIDSFMNGFKSNKEKASIDIHTNAQSVNRAIGSANGSHGDVRGISGYNANGGGSAKVNNTNHNTNVNYYINANSVDDNLLKRLKGKEERARMNRRIGLEGV